MNMYDTPRAMCWVKDRLCVGFKRDYFIVKVSFSDSDMQINDGEIPVHHFPSSIQNSNYKNVMTFGIWGFAFILSSDDLYCNYFTLSQI